MSRDRREKFGFLTPDAAPDDLLCRSFSIPNDSRWLGNFMGALLYLCESENWTLYGNLTPDESAAAYQDIFDQGFFGTNSCEMTPAPYWDEASDVDASDPSDAQPWYGVVEDILAPPDGITFEENAAIWIFTGFIAYSGEVGAAIYFRTIAPKFVLAFKRQDVGETLRVILDAQDYGTADLSTVGVGEILNFPVVANPATDTHDLYVIKTG
jgi:hypothetical protein